MVVKLLAVGIDKRGEVGEVFKNSVNQDYVNSADL